MNEQRWGRMRLRFSDEGVTLHLLRPDNGPRCGTRFYASGAEALIPKNQNVAPRCRRCERIAKKESES